MPVKVTFWKILYLMAPRRCKPATVSPSCRIAFEDHNLDSLKTDTVLSRLIPSTLHHACMNLRVEMPVVLSSEKT